MTTTKTTQADHICWIRGTTIEDYDKFWAWAPDRKVPDVDCEQLPLVYCGLVHVTRVLQSMPIEALDIKDNLPPKAQAWLAEDVEPYHTKAGIGALKVCGFGVVRHEGMIYLVEGE